MPDNKKRRRRRRNRGGGQDTLSREEMAANYGFAMAFLKQDDELWDLFKRAVNKTYSGPRFLAELKETKWYRKNSASARQMITLKIVDPATYKEQLQQMRSTVRDVYGGMLGSGPGHKVVDRMAESALMMGWDEAQLTNNILASVNMRKQLRGVAGGEVAQMKMQLTQAARAYGVRADNKWMAGQIERVLNGNNTIDGSINQLKERAMSRYAAFADEIKGGMTVEEIAAPYQQTMAELLELNPTEIDMHTPKIRRALQRKGENGKPNPMSLYEFEDIVREDPRWQFTDNAREQYATVGNELLKSFGLRA